ncbi:MAG: VOC family protein [Planctomycetota bacterium]|nr:MAG: VOC family protein [Planctomycetota bacterium]
MSRVVHFEIHAEQPERAIAFYQNVFGWTFQPYDGPMPYWMILTGPDDEPGINGGLMPRQGPIDGQAVIAYVCAVDVDSVDDAVAKIESAGGMVVVPKMPIPKVGWVAYAKDTEGNLFGVHQADPTAT